MSRVHDVRRDERATTHDQDKYIAEDCRRRHEAGKYNVKLATGAEGGRMVTPRSCTGQAGAKIPGGSGKAAGRRGCDTAKGQDGCCGPTRRCTGQTGALIAEVEGDRQERKVRLRSATTT